MNQNIFEILSDEDSENEERIAKEKQIKKQKQRQEKEEKILIAKNAEKIGKPEINKQEPIKEKNIKNKVTDEPHPLDRRSGTGQGKELKKRGGGAGNWGNFKDELNPKAQIQYVPKQEQKEEQEKKEEKVEEKSELTLEDYKKKYQIEESEEKKQQNQKKEVDISEFKKEGCTLVISKNQKNVDEQATNKKKKGGVKDHQMAMTSEHAQLLGLQTGFKPKPYFEKTQKPREEKKNEQKEIKQEVQAEPEEDLFEKEEKEQQQKQQQEQEYQTNRPPSLNLILLIIFSRRLQTRIISARRISKAI